MEKLKSMTAFVLEQNKQLKNAPDAYGQYCKIVNHANFLSQTLNISMFIPSKLVDGEWVVLEEPSHYGKSIETTRETLKEYETAKSNVLFKGFESSNYNKDILGDDCAISIINNNFWICKTFENDLPSQAIKIFTIENLITYNLTLTTTAKNQIGL